MTKRLTEQEIIDSPAWKMLESMIQDKVEELLSWQSSLEATINQAKNPTYSKQVFPKKENGMTDYKAKPTMEFVPYTPKLRTGTTFDRNGEHEDREVELKFELHELKRVKDVVDYILKLDEQIGDLNREKLYLLATDGDWQDGDRRYKRVFGKKSY